MNAAMGPLVSVVIPTYNQAHFLGRALKSVVDQTFTNWEAIVIDNHSQDNTDEVTGGFADPRITLLKIHNDGVIAASRNMGIRAAKGEWIAFLDSDDWWTSDKLEVCIRHIHDDVALIHHDLKIVRDKPSFVGERYLKGRKLTTPILTDLLVNGNAINNSSVLVRKRLLYIAALNSRKSVVPVKGEIQESIGLRGKPAMTGRIELMSSRNNEIEWIVEDPAMIGSEDYNTWLRLSQVTDGFVYISECLGYYMLHEQSVSSKDMSSGAICATSDFIDHLDEKQLSKYLSRIRYTQGRHAYVSKKYSSSKREFIYCVKHGCFKIKLRAMWMLFSMVVAK